MAKKKSTGKPKFEDNDHQIVVQQFEEFANAVQSNGAQALWIKCRQYRDGKQYTDDEIKTLRKRKQPIITDNKIQDKCDTLMGIEKQMRTDPKAYPRNPSDQDMNSAEAASDALRFIADQSHFNIKVRKGAADNLMVEGICAGQVIVEKRKGQTPKVCMERIRQDRTYYDIRSLEDDFSDKTYCGYFTWMDESVVLRDWPDAKDQIEGASVDMGSLAGDTTFDDKPRYLMTAGKRKRVQVFTHYHQKDGVWHESTWIRGGWLDEPRPCVYKNEFGDPTCCMELQALYRDAEGNPYGSVPRYLDLQDEHNKRRSKMLHLLNAKRIITRRGALNDENGSLNTARAELHKPDGVIEYSGDIADLRIEDNLAEAEGQWRLLQQTDMALSQTGPNNAIAGTSGDLSGIAKARDQQAGQLPISPLFDALDSWQLRMFQQAWNRVRQFWTSETWVRVTDSDEKPKFVGLNAPVSNGEQQAMQLKNDPRFQQLPPEQQQAQIEQIAANPQAQVQAINEKTGKPMRQNDVAVMDIDIIIERGQDVVTVQQEQFAMLSELAKTRPEVSFKTLITLSGINPTIKKQVTDELESTTNPMAVQKAMQQVQEQAQQMQKDAEELQKRAESVQADEAAVAQAKADLQVQAANLSVQEANLSKQEAQFDAHVAQAQAKDAQNQVRNAQNAATEGENKTAAISDQVSQTVQAVEQLQSAVDAIAGVVMQVDDAQRKKPRIKAIRSGRGEKGEMIAIPEYEQESAETVQ